MEDLETQERQEKKEKKESDEIRIRVAPKLRKFDAKVQIQNIGDQVAVLLYGKRMVESQESNQRGIVGRRQNILMNKINRETKYVVEMPASLAAAHPQQARYIENMVRHAQKSGLKMSLIQPV